jgi:hypothetical protein
LDTIEDQEAGQELGLEDDLDDELIQTTWEKINAVDETLPGLPSLLRELGIRLRMRFSTTFELRDLEEAIHAIQKAIRLKPLEDIANGSELLFDLGGTLDMKFSKTDNISYLEESIRALRGCVDGASTNKLDQELRTDPNRAEWLHSFAIHLGHRYLRVLALAGLEEGIRALEEGSI